MVQNGLSAKIVEEAGFKGIWASGLSISAALGVRDSNEASWTQIVEAVEYMQDAVDIPILLDGDTGFGNYNNARRVRSHIPPTRRFSESVSSHFRCRTRAAHHEAGVPRYRRRLPRG